MPAEHCINKQVQPAERLDKQEAVQIMAASIDLRLLRNLFSRY